MDAAEPGRAALFKPVFKRGRRVATASLSGFLLLYALSGLRRFRPRTLRYRRNRAGSISGSKA